MSERAKIFEALMRHLWCYWLRMPQTDDNFYIGLVGYDMAHIDHAILLAKTLADQHEDDPTVVN